MVKNKCLPHPLLFNIILKVSANELDKITKEREKKNKTISIDDMIIYLEDPRLWN